MFCNVEEEVGCQEIEGEHQRTVENILVSDASFVSWIGVCHDDFRPSWQKAWNET